MRAFLSVVVAASLVTASTLPLSSASATPAPPPTTSSDARAGAQVRGEALEGNWLWIVAGVVAFILLLLFLLDDDEEDMPVSP